MKRITLLSIAFVASCLGITAQTVADASVKYNIKSSTVSYPGESTNATENESSVSFDGGYFLTIKKVELVNVTGQTRNVRIEPLEFLGDVPANVEFELTQGQTIGDSPIEVWNKTIIGDKSGLIDDDDENETYNVNTSHDEYLEYSRALSIAKDINDKVVKGSEISNATEDVDGYPINSDLYYWNSGKTNKPKYNAVLQFEISYKAGKVYDSSCIDYYKLLNIPADFMKDHSEIMSVTLPSSVSTIEPGAFKGTNISNFYLPSGASNFVVEDGLLYTADYYALVAVSNQVTGTVKLNDKTEVVYDYALFNCNGLTVKSAKSTISYDALTQNGNIISVLSDNIPMADITVKNISAGRVGVEISTDLTTNNIEKLYSAVQEKLNTADLSSLCYIDLSGCTAVGADALALPERPEKVNPNCIVYFPNSIHCESDNAAVLDRNNRRADAGSVTIVDGKPFYSRYTVHCENVSYERNITAGKYGTIVLPFGINETTRVNDGTGLSGIMTPSNLTKREGNVLTMTRTLSMTANVPYLFLASTTCDRLNVQNVTIETSVDATLTTEANKAEFIGTYEKKVLNSSNANTYVVQNGKFAKIGANAVNVGPFRFYMHLGEEVSEAPVMRFVDSDEMDVDKVKDTNNTQALSVVAGNGVLTVSAQGEQVVVSTLAGQTIYDGALNGTRTFNVAKGVYVVNDKKYSVK